MQACEEAKKKRCRLKSTYDEEKSNKIKNMTGLINESEEKIINEIEDLGK
jgi:hypothetical protein